MWSCLHSVKHIVRSRQQLIAIATISNLNYNTNIFIILTYYIAYTELEL